MGLFPREVEAIEYVLVAAVAILIVAGIPLILRLLRSHVAPSVTSDLTVDEIASRTLAWQDAFRGPSRGVNRPWLPGLE